MAKRQKKDTPSVFDYRDVKTLQRYTNLEHFSAHQSMWRAGQQF